MHGRFFSQVIKDLRDALGLGNVFSVGLDIDDDISSKVVCTIVFVVYAHAMCNVNSKIMSMSKYQFNSYILGHFGALREVISAASCLLE